MTRVRQMCPDSSIKPVYHSGTENSARVTRIRDLFERIDVDSRDEQ